MKNPPLQERIFLYNKELSKAMCVKNLAFEILKPPHKQCFENCFVGVRRDYQRRCASKTLLLKS